MLFIPNAVRILARHRSKNPAAAPAPDCTTTSRPALVSFGTSSGTSATRRSHGADSFGTLTIICACESKGRSRLNPVICLAACHSLTCPARAFLISVEGDALWPLTKLLKLIGFVSPRITIGNIVLQLMDGFLLSGNYPLH